MKSDIKYYRIMITNPFEENNLKQDSIIVISNNECKELLTNKKVYLYSLFSNWLNKEYILDELLNKECELIGIVDNDIEEFNEEFVLKFLKFTPRIDIDKMINNINNIEKSIKNDVKNNIFVKK